MVELRSWPKRALEDIEEMIRNSLIECMSGFEQDGQRVTEIRMNRPMTNVWRTIFDRDDRWQTGPGPGHRQSDLFYGIPVFSDRALDNVGPRPPWANVVGRIRMVAMGHGSEPVDFVVESHPEAMNYNIRIRSRHGTRQKNFTYEYIHNNRRFTLDEERVYPALNRTPAQASVENVTTGEHLAREPRPKNEMCDLLIAWNS